MKSGLDWGKKQNIITANPFANTYILIRDKGKSLTVIKYIATSDQVISPCFLFFGGWHMEISIKINLCCQNTIALV